MELLINDSNLGEYDRDYTKIIFNSDDDIPLNKEFPTIKNKDFPTVTFIIRMGKDGNYYPQIFLHKCLYEI